MCEQEQIALGRLKSCGVLVEGKMITAKACHGRDVFKVIDQLTTREFGYRLIMVPGHVELPLPGVDAAMDLPKVDPFVEQWNEYREPEPLLKPGAKNPFYVERRIGRQPRGC